MIVSFSGRAGAGKDTAAKALYSRGFKKVSFAEPIKKILCEFMHLDIEHLDKVKDRKFNSPLTLNPMFCAVLIEYLNEIQELSEGQEKLVLTYMVDKEIHSMREFMQFFGTDIARELVDENIWVNYALRNVPELAVFTDVRFPNELAAMQKYEADCLYIEKLTSKYPTKRKHKSELAIKGSEKGLIKIENNGSIEELHKNVLAALNLE